MASRSLTRPVLGASRRASFTATAPAVPRAWSSTYTTPSWPSTLPPKKTTPYRPGQSNFKTSTVSGVKKPVTAASTASSPAAASPASKATIVNNKASPKSSLKPSAPNPFAPRPPPEAPRPTPESKASTSLTTKPPAELLKSESEPKAPEPQLQSLEPETQTSLDPSLYALKPLDPPAPMPGPAITKAERAAARALTAPAPKPTPLENEIDWARSYHGVAEQSFSDLAVEILTKPLNTADIEVKPDGIVYLPEIKYRRILNAAFGPGGWAMVPRGDPIVHDRVVTREHALIIEGRFISQAQGESSFFSQESIPASVEACKSNALMRCCKDIGIASELWDPVFIREFRDKHARQVWCEHVVNKQKRLLWHKVGVPVALPYKVKA